MTMWFREFLRDVMPTARSAGSTKVFTEDLVEGHESGQHAAGRQEAQKPIAYDLFATGLDLGFATCVLIFFGWLLLIIAIVVRRDSSGPALLRQVRVGKNGKEFVCWKFRTMHAGSAHRATHEMSSSAITKVGAFLRRTKLDELPQVVNLLRRELALVGPRPCLPSQIELISERERRGVYEVRPGITGYAQINNIDMSEPAVLAIWDAEYCALRSISFDMKILIATILGGGRGDRVGT